MMIEHHPPPVPLASRKKLLFMNRGEASIRISHLTFQSSEHPRLWDTMGDNLTLLKDTTYRLPICGEGQIFIRWEGAGEDRADSFAVMFDKAGDPYPYIFGGDRWTMALRHAALRATAEANGNGE